MMTTNFSEVLTMGAHLVDLQTNNGDPFRFKGIVDDDGTQLAAVTDRYALVQNVTVAQAVADALYDNGINKSQTQRGRAMYGNGRTRFDVHLPDERFTVPGDPSDIIPTIQVGNDYRGGGSLTVAIGTFRLVCTNGLIRFVRGQQLKMPHVGELGYDTVYARVADAVASTLQDAQNQQEVARLLADTARPDAWVDALLEETAKRYQPKLERALATNAAEVGNNAWAVTQAISEVATHDMHTGWAAEQWATTAVQNLIQEVTK